MLKPCAWRRSGYWRRATLAFLEAGFHQRGVHHESGASKWSAPRRELRRRVSRSACSSRRNALSTSTPNRALLGENCTIESRVGAETTTTMMPVGMECRWPLMSLKQTRARTLLTPYSSRKNCAFCCWGAVPVFLLVPVAVREPLAVEIARTQKSSLRWKALLQPSLCHREKFVSEGLLLAAPR